MRRRLCPGDEPFRPGRRPNRPISAHSQGVTSFEPFAYGVDFRINKIRRGFVTLSGRRSKYLSFGKSVAFRGIDSKVVRQFRGSTGESVAIAANFSGTHFSIPESKH